MVNRIDNLFEAMHQIILSFFFKLAIFSPALVNAVLVGFGVGSFATQKWGPVAGFVAGFVAAVAIEAASIVASWNMEAGRIASYILPTLYITGSWIVVWFGLQDGWLIDVVGFVMPIFAISLPAVIAGKKRNEKAQTERVRIEQEADEKRRLAAAEFQAERTRQEELKTKQEQERTKQARARAREVSITRKTGVNPIDKENALQWLSERPDVSPTVAANELGLSRQTIYNYRNELNGNGQ